MKYTLYFLEDDAHFYIAKNNLRANCPEGVLIGRSNKKSELLQFVVMCNFLGKNTKMVEIAAAWNNRHVNLTVYDGKGGVYGIEI